MWDDSGFHGRAGSGRGEHPDDTASTPTVPIIDTVIYISAVEYPSDYDWIRDTAYGEVEGRIVLYRDSVKILEVPTGFRRDVSASSDMHLISDGHLYTFFANDYNTIIKCDGKEIISYPGRDIIKGFLVKDGHVHSLGQDRDGGGISYRIDGEVVHSKSKAFVIGEPDDGLWPTGALYRDDEDIVFAYRTVF